MNYPGDKEGAATGEAHRHPRPRFIYHLRRPVEQAQKETCDQPALTGAEQSEFLALVLRLPTT